MESKKTEVGWKRNIDKLLFILASFYVIGAMVWLWKNQQQASASRSNDSISEVEISEEIKSSETVSNNNVKSASSNSTKLQDISNKESTLASELMDSIPSQTIIEQNEQESLLSNLDSPPIETQQVISFSGNDNQSPNLSITQSSSSLPAVSMPPPPPVAQPIQPPPLPVQIPPRPQSPSQQGKVTSRRRVNRVPVIEKVSQDAVSFANQSQDYSRSYPIGGSEDNLRNTLLGIVELENNSVALFNLNNLTEKVEVGSEIGATGWILMGISGKQAILNRNNQSLYLMVGEKF